MIIRRLVAMVAIATMGAVTISGPVAASGGRGARVSIELVSTKNAKPLTKAQFITKANALCADGVTAFAADSSQFAGIKTNPTPQAISAFVSALSSIVQSQINKTRALKPPKVDQGQVTKFLQDDQTELNMVKADPQLLSGAHSPFLAADTLARKLGLVGAPGSGPCTKGSA
jgi:hypothetical protein